MALASARNLPSPRRRRRRAVAPRRDGAYRHTVGLSDVTGVFSRYFVVGFFLPAYTGLVALWLSASDGFVSDELQRHTDGTQLAILGGVALVLALLLSGLRYPATRLAEGYPLLALRRWRLTRWMPDTAIRLQRRRYERLEATRRNKEKSDVERGAAYGKRDRLFPRDANRLLPTQLGNVMRAYESHAEDRWGIDGVLLWPHIQALMSEAERDLITDAETDLRVFLNGAFAAVGIGICLIGDRAANQPGAGAGWLLCGIPFAVAYLLYRWSIRAAAIRGAYVRASFDLHRLDVYEKLGIRRPKSFTDERQMATRLNQLLFYGRPRLDDALWLSNPAPTEDNQP